MPIWNCPECGRQFIKPTENGLRWAKDNHERKHRHEMEKSEKIVIEDYEVPLYLVERYMRTTRGCGNQVEAHEAIYVWLASKYKDAKEFSRLHGAHFYHMHIETAQRILAGESPYEDWGRFKPLAKFQLELDKVCERLWSKESRKVGINYAKWGQMPK